MQKTVIKNRRGQLMLFVVLAILIVAGLVLFFTLRPSSSSSSGVDALIDDSVSECVAFITKSSYQFVTYQGGYHTQPVRSFNFSPTFFPYYYYEGQNLIPTISDFESEMGAFVDEHIGECFESFESSGYEVSYTTPNTDVTIDTEGVTYVVDSTLTLTKADATVTVDLTNYKQDYESKLYYLYETANFFVQDQVDDPDFYCISCITRMAETHDFKFYIFPLVDTVYFVTVFTEDEDPTVLNFVAKYKE